MGGMTYKLTRDCLDIIINCQSPGFNDIQTFKAISLKKKRKEKSDLI